MDIRLFDLDKDFAIIKNWITDERTNMLWCANRIQYPMSKTIFKDFLKEISDKYGDIPYVAVADENVQAVQLNVFSVNEPARKCYQNIGFVERNVTKEAVNFGDETWDRINMLIKC